MARLTEHWNMAKGIAHDMPQAMQPIMRRLMQQVVWPQQMEK